MASGLVRLTDTSLTSWQRDAHHSFSYHQPPSWSGTNPRMSGSSGRILVTLYNQTNITTFTTTTIFPANATITSRQISSPLNLVATATPRNTMKHTTTLISNPRASASKADIPSDKMHPYGDDQAAPPPDPLVTTTAIALSDASLSGCQNIVISIIINIIPLSSLSTADPEDTSPQDSPIQPLNLPSWQYTEPSSQGHAKGQTSIATPVGESEPLTPKPWSPLSASAIIGLSSSVLAPPYPFNFLTTFLPVSSGSARDPFSSSASTFATSVHPNLFSLSHDLPSSEDLTSTLADPSSTPQPMVSFVFTDSSISTVVEVISIIK